MITTEPLTPTETARRIRDALLQLGIRFKHAFPDPDDVVAIESALWDTIPDGTAVFDFAEWAADAFGDDDITSFFVDLPWVVETSRAYDVKSHPMTPEGCDPDETIGGTRVHVVYCSPVPMMLTEGFGPTTRATVLDSEDRGDDGDSFSELVRIMYGA